MNAQEGLRTALYGVGLGGLVSGASVQAQEVRVDELPGRAHVVSVELGEDEARLSVDLLTNGAPGVSLSVDLFEDSLAVGLAAALQGFAATVRVMPGAAVLVLFVDPGGETAASAQLTFPLP
jgi:hypothetical protein